jgi:hypothetical protein
MIRRRRIDIAETLLRPTRRLEIHRRTRDYLLAHRLTLRKRELAAIDEAIREIEFIIAMGDVHPLDDPEPRREEPQREQPLVPEGAEWMHDWMAEFAS